MGYRLEGAVGLRLAREEATRKWFPASNSAREVLPQPVALHCVARVHVLGVLSPADDMLETFSVAWSCA